jgi:hypothetical protein
MATLIDIIGSEIISNFIEILGGENVDQIAFHC